MNVLEFLQLPLSLGTFTLPVSILKLLLELFLPLLAVILVGTFVKKIIRTSLNKATLSETIKQNLKQVFVWVVRILQISAALVLFLRLLGASINVIVSGFISALNTPIYCFRGYTNIGTHSISNYSPALPIE